MKNKKIFAKLFVLLLAVFGTVSVVFLYVKHQALSATVNRDGAASINTQRFAFPARSGDSTFKVISLPEIKYSADTTGGTQVGSSIFTVWDGTSTTSAYMNFAHMGQNSDTSDDFLMQFFDQEQCITDSKGKPAAGAFIEKKFTATFIKPNLVPSPPPGQPVTKIVIRAYDDFKVEWGNGKFTVTMQRYWRVITLPPGVTPETFSPNDYNILKPESTDVPSPGIAVVKTLDYKGEFAPFSTRIGHGDPYDTDKFARPAQVKVNKQDNLDFNFYDIKTSAQGEGTDPVQVTCRMNTDTVTVEKTQPCGCLNDKDTKTCGDPEVPFVDLWPPVQFSLFGGTQWQVQNISDLRDATASYGEQLASDAAIRLELNTYDPSPGDKFQLSAFTSSYHTKPEDTYFSWCFNGKSQQGLVAGGDWITQTKSNTATKDADSSGCCDLVTRTPQVDANHDGIDDNWQLKYGFKLTGKKDYMLPADYDADSSGASTSTSGLPGDGFVANQFLDLNGDRIAVTPSVITAPKTGFPNGEEFITGDGHFTAAEEYIWGTDPTEYDSDFDGYPDEADIVGVGQKKLEFISTIQPRDFPTPDNQFGNDRYIITAKSLGRTGQKRSTTTNPSDAQTTSGLELDNVVRIAEDTKSIFARDPGSMSVTLTVNPEAPGLSDTFKVESSLDNGTRSGGNPYYYWYAKRIAGNGNNPGTGQPDGKAPFAQGEGLHSVTQTIRSLCPECQPGDELQISLEVDDTLRGDVATYSISLNVGTTNSLQIFQDCNKDGTDDEVGSPTYCFKSAGVSKNIPVRVSVSFLDAISSKYYFQWKLDSVLQTSNCLLPNQSSTTTPQKCGFGTDQMVFTPTVDRKDYPVEVFVYRNDQNIPSGQFNPIPSAEVSHFTTTISSGTPAVTIVFEPTPADKNGGYAVGATVTARAVVDFLNPNPQGQLIVDPNVPGTKDGAKALRYVWRDSLNKILKVEEIPSNNGSTIAFTNLNPGIAELSVVVTSPDYTAPSNPSAYVAVSTVNQTYFSDVPTTPTALRFIQTRLAAVLSFVPRPVAQALQVLAVIVFAGVIVAGFASAPMWKRS